MPQSRKKSPDGAEPRLPPRRIAAGAGGPIAGLFIPHPKLRQGAGPQLFLATSIRGVKSRFLTPRLKQPRCEIMITMGDGHSFVNSGRCDFKDPKPLRNALIATIATALSRRN
jgi:hypothetical protein